jgi:hypothetical protein
MKILNQKKADLATAFESDCVNIVSQAKDSLAALRSRLYEEVKPIS